MPNKPDPDEILDQQHEAVHAAIAAGTLPDAHWNDDDREFMKRAGAHWDANNPK